VLADDPEVTDQMWIDAARTYFRGSVIVGKDLPENLGAIRNGLWSDRFGASHSELKALGINTYKSLSKQRILKPSRINTCGK